MLRAKSIRNSGKFTRFKPMCLVTYLKSEKGESITKPLILCNCDFADMQFLEISAKLME